MLELSFLESFFVVLFSVFDILNLKIFLVYLDVLPKSMLKNFEIKYFHYIKKDYLQNDMNTLLHVFAKPSAYMLIKKKIIYDKKSLICMVLFFRSILGRDF